MLLGKFPIKLQHIKFLEGRSEHEMASAKITARIPPIFSEGQTFQNGRFSKSTKPFPKTLFFCQGSVFFWVVGGIIYFLIWELAYVSAGALHLHEARNRVCMGWSVDSRLERVPRDRGWNMVECHEQSAGNWSVSWIKGANHIKGILHTICTEKIDDSVSAGWFQTMLAPLLGKCQGICGQGWVFLVVSWWFREVTDAYLKPS